MNVFKISLHAEQNANQLIQIRITLRTSNHLTSALCTSIIKNINCFIKMNTKNIFNVISFVLIITVINNKGDLFRFNKSVLHTLLE